MTDFVAREGGPRTEPSASLCAARESFGRAKHRRLTLQVFEGQHGWCYIVYRGKGTKPGDALHGAGAMASFETAYQEGRDAILRLNEVPL